MPIARRHLIKSIPALTIGLAASPNLLLAEEKKIGKVNHEEVHSSLAGIIAGGWILATNSFVNNYNNGCATAADLRAIEATLEMFIAYMDQAGLSDKVDSAIKSKADEIKNLDIATIDPYRILQFAQKIAPFNISNLAFDSSSNVEKAKSLLISEGITPTIKKLNTSLQNAEPYLGYSVTQTSFHIVEAHFCPADVFFFALTIAAMFTPGVDFVVISGITITAQQVAGGLAALEGLIAQAVC